MASEPPQPPQKHVPLVGRDRHPVDGRPKPMPWRSGTPSTRSMPLHCSSNTASIVSLPSRRTPLASPPHAIGVWIEATERALPWPPAAGISARRHATSHDLVASRTGLPNVLASTLVGSRSSGIGSGGGGMTWATRSSAAGGVPMWKSAPSGPVMFSRDELAERLPGDPLDDLALEVALGDGVVARRRARLPPRRLGAEQGGRLAAVVEVLVRDRLLPARQPGRVAHDVAHLDVALALGGELRPHVATGA